VYEITIYITYFIQLLYVFQAMRSLSMVIQLVINFIVIKSINFKEKYKVGGISSAVASRLEVKGYLDKF